MKLAKAAGELPMVCIAGCSSSPLVSRSCRAADASMSTREYFSSWRCISMRTLVASLFPIERLIRESAWTPNDRLEERTFADTGSGPAPLLPRPGARQAPRRTFAENDHAQDLVLGDIADTGGADQPTILPYIDAVGEAEDVMQ